MLFQKCGGFFLMFLFCRTFICVFLFIFLAYRQDWLFWTFLCITISDFLDVCFLFLIFSLRRKVSSFIFKFYTLFHYVIKIHQFHICFKTEHRRNNINNNKCFKRVQLCSKYVNKNSPKDSRVAKNTLFIKFLGKRTDLDRYN